MLHLFTCVLIHIGVEFCPCFMITVAFLCEIFNVYFTFISSTFTFFFFFYFLSSRLKSLLRNLSLCIPWCLRVTLGHWLEALSIKEMLVWCELLCRSIRMGSLKGKLQISVSFQCHIFHHRLVIFPRKNCSSMLPGGWKSSSQCSGLRKTDMAWYVSKANTHIFI